MYDRTGAILTELFGAMSLAHGEVPSEWKRANVVPVPKKDDPSEINNYYRPISLLCFVSKVLERIVHRQVYEFIAPSCVTHANYWKYFIVRTWIPERRPM
jgi:hypothetical protein